ncbi:N-acetylmuramoyl-L-alanine amidase [Alkalihalobacterium elongatum]|uniref:N-acetylmuramoyl-L-alanine amidase n=1 Tax=Alkalihalobacterium elongatum TaxID=2675466 RepID=UPI001C200398|nr:N-acetylmuramoyl-L-alanine amidase [Alkalihalobacterium elongatum]
MVRSKWAIVCLCIILLSSFYIGYDKHTSANQSQIIATGTVQASSLNVRQTPTTSGTRVASLTQGATISIYETGVNGNWLKIKMNNQWAYVHGDYVRVTPVSNSSNNSNSNSGSIIATGTVNVNSLNVRQSPSTTSARVGSLSRGASVSIYEMGISGNWLKIRVNNQWAYVHGDFITITGNNNSSSNNNSNNNNSSSSSIIATGAVNVNSLNVRRTASATGTRVGSLSRGTTIQIYERNVNGGWLKIKMNNQWAFVHGDYVTISSNNQSNSGSSSNNSSSNASNTIIATGTVNVNSLNVRQTAATSGTRVGSLARGATVSIYERNVNGNWLKIKMNNQWAYVHGDYITVTVSNNNQNNNSGSSNNSNNNNSNTVIATGTVNVNLLNVRQTASASGTRVGSLNRGATVSIYEQNVNGGWLKIKLNNQWAYVHGDYVTISSSNSNSGNSSNNSSNSNSIVTTGAVNVTTLNVRQTPSTSGTRVGALARGASVSIYETNVNGNWLKIKHNNQWAYIHGDHVTVTVNNNSQTSSGSTNNRVPSNALAGKTIVIDAGHGGNDPGAVANGLREKDVVLRVSLALQKKLEAAGANVVMTRTTDTFVSVNSRFDIANRANGHSFVSIHTNSLSNSQAHGTETFWNRSNQHAESQKLAQVAQKHLVQQLKTRDRGVKEGNFGVVRYTKIPSILVELGFITNPSDAAMMKQDRFYEDASEALLNALIEFHK